MKKTKDKKTKETKPDELLKKYYKFATTSKLEVVVKLLDFLKSEYGKKLIYAGYFLHNRDIYNKQDEELNKEHKAGTKKPKHYHISLCFNTQIRLGTIHNKIKEIITEEDDKNINKSGFIVVHNQKNRGEKTSFFAICNMIDYWFHIGEANKHKTQYTKEDRETAYLYGLSWKDYDKYYNTYISKEAVEVDNFDKSDYKKLTKMESLIRNGKTTLQQIESEDEAFYLDNRKRLELARDDFIRKIKKPDFQQVFYIYGSTGGIGKSLFSKLWASKLGTVFYMGKENVRFQLYTGEHSIVWNDVRHKTIKNYGVDNWLDDFDTTKPSSAVNKKNGVVLLKNKYWFMNGIQDIDTLITFYNKETTTDDSGYSKTDYVEAEEDTAQFRRRINPIRLVYSDDIETLAIYLYKTENHYKNYKQIYSKQFHIKIEDKKIQPKLYELYDLITDFLISCWDDDKLEWKEDKLNQTTAEISTGLDKLDWINDDDDYKS